MGYGFDEEDWGGILADLDFYGECSNCGEIIDDDTVKCPQCGCRF